MAYRNTLLPAYLAENPVWQEMIESFEEAFGDEYDRWIDAVALSRNTHLFDDEEDENGVPLVRSTEHLYIPERETLVYMAQMLGFNYPSFQNRLFSVEDYMRIVQWMSLYVKEQGFESFMDFFSYCLGTELTISPLWSKDYTSFVPESDAQVKALQDGIIKNGKITHDTGAFYPTSHVDFVVDPFSNFNLSIKGFRDFFNYVAPINLVLHSISFRTRGDSNLGISMVGVTTVVY